MLDPWVMTESTARPKRRRQTGEARRASKSDYRERQARLEHVRKLRGPVLDAVHSGEYLDCSRWVIYELIKTGELKASRLNGNWRISIDELDDFIRRNSDEAAS